MRRTAPPRGFTLVELLVASAVAGIIILAAVLAASSIFSLSQGRARRSSAEATLALASVSIDRYVANTASGFANSRYAFRVRNNVTAASTVPASFPAVVSEGDASDGFVSGTDVLELSWGNPARRPAQITSSGALTINAGDTLTFSMGDLLAQEEWNGTATNFNPPVLLLTREVNPTQACIVAFDTPTNGSWTVHVTSVLDDDLAASGAGCTIQPGSGDIVVYKLDGRVRLFVYQKANAQDLGLYRQEMDPATGDFISTSTQAPQAVALGVENLQLAPVLGPQVDGGFPGVGSCTSAFCRCSDAASPTCAASWAGGFTGPGSAPSATNALIRAVDAQVTVMGDRREGERRPASFDSAAGPVDGRRRVMGTVSLNIPNTFLAFE